MAKLGCPSCGPQATREPGRGRGQSVGEGQGTPFSPFSPLSSVSPTEDSVLSNSHCKTENGVQQILVMEAQSQVDTAGNN